MFCLCAGGKERGQGRKYFDSKVNDLPQVTALIVGGEDGNFFCGIIVFHPGGGPSSSSSASCSLLSISTSVVCSQVTYVYLKNQLVFHSLCKVLLH